MCDQTEISYLDGDVVWVKIGACWWPGQVTGFDKLPEDIQLQFKKKPLIAAVKFFQEDTYEYVKNLKQIYKYNCRQKDDFIKKGLDKYRSKVKDGSNYMDKFPGDVETAEKLTDGDPNILLSSKFSPEQKPDISSLFGEKKLPKRKKDKDDSSNRSFGNENIRKITHPRFVGRESDHEVRIRQQPISYTPPKSDDSATNLYSCPLCSFTSTRVNVVICHNKSHRPGDFESPNHRPIPQKSRSVGVETTKRKYVRKNKSLSTKLKVDKITETPKRKYNKQNSEKSAKKKKTDPELREKLLADWDDGSEDGMEVDLDNSTSDDLLGSPISKNDSQSQILDEKNEDSDDNESKILKESENLLKDTDKLSSSLKNSSGRLEMSPVADKSRSPLSKKPKKFSKEVKNSSPEKDDQKSKLSCFDFDEEEPEPTFTPTRKITRVYGEKNTSLKKEIIKEFTMSQALAANEKVVEEEKMSQKVETKDNDTKKDLKEVDDDIDKFADEINQTVNEAKELVAKIAEETENSNLTKSKSEATETELEIVEILEVERDKDEEEEPTETLEIKKVPKDALEVAKDEDIKDEEIKSEDVKSFKSEEIDSGRVTIESEEETMSLSQITGTASESSALGDIGWSQLSDIIGAPGIENLKEKSQTPDIPEKRRRGRPKKSIIPTDVSGNGNSLSKIDDPQPPGTPDSQDFDRKTSESEGERSYTGRRRKPSKKFLESDIYSSSPGRKTPRTDDSQSETEEKPLKNQKRGKRGRKPSGINKYYRKSFDDTEFSDQNLDSAEESAGVSASLSPDMKSLIKSSEISPKSGVMSPVNITDLLATADVEIRNHQILESPSENKILDKAVEENDKIDKLPPKKSQIKKFERSKFEFLDAEEQQTEVKSTQENLENDMNKILTDNQVAKIPENVLEDIDMETGEIVEETIENIEVIEEVKETDDLNIPPVKSVEEQLESMEQEQEKSEIIISEEKLEETKPEEVVEKPVEVSEEHAVTVEEPTRLPEDSPNEPLNLPEIEKLDEKVEEKIEEEIREAAELARADTIPTEDISFSLPESPKPPSLPPSPKKNQQVVKKIIQTAVESPKKSEAVSVPVKKREKPRIIENVALKEPMQILKSKLLEKQPTKLSKHKLDSEMSKKLKAMGIPPAKMMKIDSPSGKTKSVSKSGTGQLPISQKLQLLKAEEAKSQALNEQVIESSPGVISLSSGGSQGLQDIELDINSIPFVLSEDLNPDNIEQMPVMLSGIISNSSPSISTTLTFTQSTQPVTQQLQLTQKSTETVVEPSPAKKKTASPAILKNKGKAKPTITSIKTLHPPMTGGVKGMKFQNPQGKPLPLISQKGSPGKYVIVQASTGQQMRYTVQGKTGLSPKMSIQQGKSPNHPQIVQQGSKVLILTSQVSGQTKTVPLTQKVTPNKVQKIMNTKGPIYSQQISSKNAILSSKSSDASSPTTSKLGPGQKIITTHPGMIASKIYTGTKTIFVPAEVGKNAGLLGKGNTVYTSLATTGYTTKNIIGQKTLMTNKGTIVGTIGGQGGSKTILAPISQASLAGKTIISSQNLVSGKGTVLTPITGQQVKAIAAKSPAKGQKVQYQSLQQKVHLPMLQKCQKVPISSGASPNMRIAGSVKNAGGTLVFQNAGQSPQGTLTKISTQGKKIIRHNVVPQMVSSPNITKTKTIATTPMTQKVAISRGRPPTKPQQKVVIQKYQESSPARSNVSSTITKANASAKTNMSTSPVVKNVHKSYGSTKTPQKHLMSPMASASSTLVSESSPILPTQELKKPEIISEEIKETISTPNDKIVEQKAEISTDVAKIDEQKVPHQPQIMALPTESADGTQTYVLVTIDEQGTIHPLDNNALMSLEGTTTNPDGTRTLYIDPSSLGDTGGLDNIVLQFDNASGSGLTTGTQGTSAQKMPAVETECSTFSSSNQDILAAALANTDFQGEIGLSEPSGVTMMPACTSVMSSVITQTSLINQTILQSTIIPTSDPISSPSVLETSLTLNQPIMTPLEVPSSISIPPEIASTSITTVPTSLELPISINSGISYLSESEGSIQLPGNSMPDIGEIMETPQAGETLADSQSTTQYLVIPNLADDLGLTGESGVTSVANVESTSDVSYAVSIPENVEVGVNQITPPSMPIIDDSFVENLEITTKPDDKIIISTQIETDTSNSGEISEAGPSDMLSTESQVEKEISKVSEEAEEHPVTSESNRGMPIIVEAEETESKIDSKILNSDVVDSCMFAEDSNVPPPECSSEDVQSSEKPAEISISEEIAQTSQEAETSEKREVEEVVTEQVEAMEVDEAPYNPEEEIKQSAESSSVPEVESMECVFSQDNDDAQPAQETPSQSFEQSKNTENAESPSQSPEKSSDSREPSQSEADELMEVAIEPPTQSFEDSTGQEASQSFQEVSEVDRGDQGEIQDDPSFPTQSYEVEKVENLPEILETDGELSQEGNIPSQSNDVGVDSIGTSTFLNQGNDDETASSSYVPETPETQERDQDQESAISTSSYEIPPCDEINIASSSVIPDTSGTEHASIHDNGVPEIPTSSYNLNPDSSSTHVDSVPSSSFEDQVVVEQNVSTSYEVPISMPGIEENSSGNFVSESGSQRNEPSSYYARNPEEVTSEASQSYFVPEDPSPSYAGQTVSPSYYDPSQETEASQSFYSTEEIERTDQSSSRNVEASQSFYQENSNELRLRQQGEATPTYTERYPVDYPLENSPIERHDLVDSSVPATRPAER